MLEIGLLGGDFLHAHSSTLWKSPSFFKWDKGNVRDISFFIDRAIMKNLETKSEHKFGWIVESRVIIPDVINDIKKNYIEISNSYDYIFTHYKEIYQLADNFIYFPPHGYWIEKPLIYPKNKTVSLVSSNKRMGPGHDFRLKWVAKLKNKVDIFGRGIKTINKKEEALCDYMFSVVIENDQYETYWTEKILDCFVTGAIPIYHGAPDIFDFFNKDGIIILKEDFDPSTLTKELYDSKRNAMLDNFNRALKYNIIEDLLYEKYIKNLEV